MKLLDYMKANGIDDSDMAVRVGETTPRAVKKWKYGETTPPLAKILRIQDITAGQVKPCDFLPDHPQAQSEVA